MLTEIINFLKSLLKLTSAAKSPDSNVYVTKPIEPIEKKIPMISMSELLMGRAKLEELPKEIQDNLAELHKKINIIRAAYGKPMKVNDGYRRAQDRPKNGSATSWHYRGAAVDIDDNDAGDFAKWVIANLKLVRDAGLYIEHPNWTNGCGSWVHFQIKPPRSGKRVFIPSTKPACNPNLWDGKYDPALDK